MALKKPSDFFREDNKSDDTIHELVKRPELQSFSEAFNVYKNNLDKLDNLADTIKCVEDIKSEIQDFIKKEDLDNSMMAYTFLLEESINKLKDDVKSINKKDLLQIQGDVSGLTEQINEFVEIEIPKYNKIFLDSEVSSSRKYDEFKEEINNIIDNIDNYTQNSISSILEDNKLDKENLNEILNETISKLEEKINDATVNKKDLNLKITEIKNLKKSIIDSIEISEDHRNNVNKKVSNLEIEIVRNNSNLKEHNKSLTKIQKNLTKDFNNVREEFKTTISKLNLNEIEDQNYQLSKKVNYLQEVFEKFNEKEILSESIISEPSETDNSDPLTPLNKKYVTLDQLQDHYRIFVNRVQQQLATLGGGGETQLKYLDDIVGIATNPSAYDGGYLRYVHSLKKFTFGTPADGSTWIQGVDGPYSLGRVGIGTEYIQSGLYPNNALVVEGNTRITGILSVGTASITLNAETGSISSGEVEVVSAGGGAKFTGIITASGADFDGNVTIGGTLTYEDVKNVDSVGIITARKDVRVGRNFNVTGLSTFVGLSTFNDGLIVTSGVTTVGFITATDVSVSGILTTGQIADSNGSVGSASSVLSSTGSGLSWVEQSAGGGSSGIGSVGIQSGGVLVGSATTINFTAGDITVANDIANVSVGSSFAYAGARVFFSTGTPAGTSTWYYVSSSNITTVNLDTNSFYNDSNGRYEIPAGVTKVRLRANIYADSGSGSPANVWRPYKNGSAIVLGSGGFYFEVETGSGYANMGSSGVSDVIPVSEGDYIQLAYQVNATTRSFAGTWQLEVVEGSLLGHYFASTNVTNADNVTVQANNSTDETVYPIFVDGATGIQGPESDTGFTYNPSSGNLTATQLTGSYIVGTALSISSGITTVGFATATDVWVSGAVTATTFDAPSYYTDNTKTRDKYRLWTNSNWAIGMDEAMSFGGLNHYAITLQAAGTSDDRGWVFLDSSHTDAQGAMSLNTIGELVVAKSIRAGGGESDTSAPRKPLDIIGDGFISGGVGIGTTDPVAKLDVYVNNAANSGIIQITQDGIGDAAIDFQLKGIREYTLGIDNSDADKFKLSSTAGLADEDNLLIITTGGDVGIGSDNPTSKLDVDGTVKATDFDATSDIRLKTNIQPIGDPLAKVIQIEGVSFNWKENNRPALGVIADQIESILPELVHGNDPKTVNYNGLIGLLIEAVKEQQTHIDNLNERISKLE